MCMYVCTSMYKYVLRENDLCYTMMHVDDGKQKSTYTIIAQMRTKVLQRGSDHHGACMYKYTE